MPRKKRQVAGRKRTVTVTKKVGDTIHITKKKVEVPVLVSAVEFKAIRERLGLTQTQLAELLGYSHLNQVSAFERQSTGGRAVPLVLALLMQALDSGWWPESWPKEGSIHDPESASEAAE